MRIYKKMSISASHTLKLPYQSACNRLHGHNYTIEIWLERPLDDRGMVMDFVDIKNVVNELDHRDLNAIIKHPTAENMVQYLMGKFWDMCSWTSVKVRVWETDTGYAEDEKRSV